MTTRQLINFYGNKRDVPCPLTEALIKAGYQQERDGYIKYAYEQGINVDYRKAEPGQWWHLTESYCNRTDLSAEFTYRIRCGELYYWMAEVSGCFEKSELISLAEKAIKASTKVKRKKDTLPPLKTAKGNAIIRAYCFERIRACVEAYAE